MKYDKPIANEWVQPVRRGYRMMCCDCGLVHRLNFRVIRWGRGFKVLFQVFRHERATASARRSDRFQNNELSKARAEIRLLKESRAVSVE